MDYRKMKLVDCLDKYYIEGKCTVLSGAIRTGILQNAKYKQEVENERKN